MEIGTHAQMQHLKGNWNGPNGVWQMIIENLILLSPKNATHGNFKRRKQMRECM